MSSAGSSPRTTTPTDINLLGEYNVAGDLWNVTPLFERLGVRILAAITGDARFRQVASAHRARLNMMVCSQALINLARKMKERWGIPYFEGSFYGVSATSLSLRTIARMLVAQGAAADLLARTEDLIATEEARVGAELDPLLPRLEGKRALLYTGEIKSWSVISALQDAGMVVIGTSVRKSTPGDKARAQALMGEDGELFETLPQREMYRMLKAGEADIMLSGGRTQFVALKAKALWLRHQHSRRFCSHPRKKSSSGTAMKKKVKIHAPAIAAIPGQPVCKCKNPRPRPSASASGVYKASSRKPMTASRRRRRRSKPVPSSCLRAMKP